MSQALSAILFDHDGLLVETELLFYQVTQEVLRQRGVSVTKETWSRDYLSKGRPSAEIALEHGYPEAFIDQFTVLRNARYRSQLQKNPPLYPGVREVLQLLGARYRLGLVTGNSREAIETVHRTTGLLSVFEIVVTQEDFEKPKPKPDAYLVALERLGLSSARCIAIEDSERGMQAALAAGLRCVAIPGEFTKIQEFSGAARVLGSISELPQALEDLVSRV